MNSDSHATENHNPSKELEDHSSNEDYCQKIVVRSHAAVRPMHNVSSLMNHH